MAAIEAVLIGAGQRGIDAIGAFAKSFPDELKFVAVAEVDKGRREYFAKEHNISPENCFASYEQLFDHPQIAPLCFNTTMDKAHLTSALLAFDKGYHLFLEKPMADTPEGCLRIAEASMEKKLMLQICHGMRYTPFYNKVKALLSDGAIGKLISLSMYENVHYWHFGHSFVRGNWGRVEECGPLILTKCCHDMDCATWLADSEVRKVSSFGSLNYFHEENAPKGSPKRCLDGCPIEKTCPFYAPAQYLGEWTDWPVSVISLDKSIGARRKAIEEGQYGRCVFKCGNSAVDNQIVNAEFENDATLNFAVYANTRDGFRTIRAIGTEGELNGHLEKSEISVTRFVPGFYKELQTQSYRTEEVGGGHMGGDRKAIRDFLRCYKENDYEKIEHSLKIAVEGHLLSFCAEEARVKEQVIEMEQYKRKFKLI